MTFIGQKNLLAGHAFETVGQTNFLVGQRFETVGKTS